MSVLYDMRRALADAIIAANIGWTDDTVLIKRQTDLWNDVATAMSSAENGAVLHIGVAEGESQEGDDLVLNLTVPLTILIAPVAAEGGKPEEDLWEDLLAFVNKRKIPATDHTFWEFTFKSFSDGDLEADEGTRYLARQSIFTKKIYIPSA
jgi:hypothetical protein